MSEQKAICPFCGHKPKTTIEKLGSGIWKATASCEPCALTMHAFGRTRDEARERLNRRWNTRYERTCHPIWKRSKQQGRLTDTCECSECGGCLDDLRLGYNAGFSPYCPYCGAKVVDE